MQQSLLQLSRKSNLISEELFRLTEPIRDLRNTIHPKVQQRLKGNINESMVMVAYNVLNQVIHSIKLQSSYYHIANQHSVINRIIAQKFNDKPDEIDYMIFQSILQKYGLRIGEKIIKRSLDEL